MYSFKFFFVYVMLQFDYLLVILQPETYYGYKIIENEESLFVFRSYSSPAF